MGKLLIKDDKYEPVEQEAGSYGCSGCAFDCPSAACSTHACFDSDFPDKHPLRGKRIVWIAKEVA